MMHLENVKLPRFRFDWDPVTRKLYLVQSDKPVSQQIGELIREGVPTPDVAKLIVAAWCGGYLAKERERFDPKAPQHHRLVAETGRIPIFGGTAGQA